MEREMEVDLADNEDLDNYFLSEYSDGKYVYFSIYFPPEPGEEYGVLRVGIAPVGIVDVRVSVRGPFADAAGVEYLRLHDMSKPAGYNLIASPSGADELYGQLIGYAS